MSGIERVVAKAGGTSNATAEAVQQSLSWAEQSDIFVVSAPGALPGDGVETEKVTKLLKKARQDYVNPDGRGRISLELVDTITERYAAIVHGLGSKSMHSMWIDAIPVRVHQAVLQSEHAASMLGERLQAEIYEGQGFTLLDPGRSRYDLDDEPTWWRQWLDTVVQKDGKYVLPGNTTRSNGQLVTFDEGGSDISGGLAAYGIHADLNLNLTDNPALSANPKIITPSDRAQYIPHMLYAEGRELGRNGTGLVHPAAMTPLMKGNIPTEIRSTFDLHAPATRLDSDEERARSRRSRVLASSLMENVVIHQVYEPGMAEKRGRLAAFDTALAEVEVPIIDSQGNGVDGQKYYIAAKHAKVAQKALEKVVEGKVRQMHDVDLITMVGYDLRSRVIDHMMGVALNAGLDMKEWQREGHELSFGDHSLRMSVESAKSRHVYERLHAHFCENE